MKVTAKPGTKCPKEGSPREYIADAETGEDVPDTVYYRRLIMDGSLAIVPVPAEPATPEKTDVMEENAVAPQSESRHSKPRGGKS